MIYTRAQLDDLKSAAIASGRKVRSGNRDGHNTWFVAVSNFPGPDIMFDVAPWVDPYDEPLDRASAKLGVEAPRVEKPCSNGTCPTCKGTGLEEDDYGPGTHTCPSCAGNGNGQAKGKPFREQALAAAGTIPWVDRFREQTIKSCAAGPWKAWPENPVPDARVRFVKGELGGCRFWSAGIYFEALKEWRASDRTARRLDGVTHFAELNTEGM